MTDTSIEIRTVSLSATFLAILGVPDPQVERVYRAYAAEVNDEGGIHGRKINISVVYIQDPPSEEMMTQACERAIEDEGAFMLLGDATYAGIPDCAATRGRPLTDTGYGPLSSVVADDVARTAGLYWTAGPTAERLMPQWVAAIAAEHGIDTKIGVLVHSEGNLGAAKDALVSELGRRGFPAPEVFEHHDDEGVSATQSQSIATTWRAAGVELVMPITNALHGGNWQRGFTTRAYFPDWTFSSIGLFDNPVVAPFMDPLQFDGAVGVSWARMLPESENAECKAILARRDPDAPWSSLGSMACHMFFQNVEVLRRAGQDLTAASWVNAYRSLGEYHGNYTERASYSATKQDGADQYRILRFNSDDRSQHPAGSYEALTDWLD